MVLEWDNLKKTWLFSKSWDLFSQGDHHFPFLQVHYIDYKIQDCCQIRINLVYDSRSLTILFFKMAAHWPFLEFYNTIFQNVSFKMVAISAVLETEHF